MDIQQQSTQPISDDQELAKVLAGVSAEADAAETTPAPAEDSMPSMPAMPPMPQAEPPVAPPADLNTTMAPLGPPPAAMPVSIPVNNELDSVKQQAITELRPLVDKLTLPPEERFDTYLLLIRSTDDKTLIAPAHEAAKEIADETRRAEALLNIIKEIDFLSGAAQTA